MWALTFVDLVLLNTFQKRSVSSPAPVTMDSPSGDIAWRKQHAQVFNTGFMAQLNMFAIWNFGTTLAILIITL